MILYKWNLYKILISLLICTPLTKCSFMDSFRHVMTIINHLPNKNINEASLFELLFKKKPSLDFIKIFGSTC